MRRTLATSVIVVMSACLAVPGGAAAGRDWRRPVEPLAVIAAFDRPEQPWLAGHRGIDLATTPGTTVRAVGAGRITFAGTVAGRGVVVVDHGTLRTSYEPVRADVSRGDRIAAGEPLGTIQPGAGHCGTGRCLHLGLRRGREYLDPMLLFARRSVRLLPW